MKKFIFLLIACLLSTACAVAHIDNDLDNEIVMFSSEILSYTFDCIRVNKESSKVQSIDLIGPDDTIVAHITLPETLSSEFYDIRYEYDDLYFIQSFAIDDESGIIYSNDAFVCMNGLHRVERIGRHTYSFATYL